MTMQIKKLFDAGLVRFATCPASVRQCSLSEVRSISTDDDELWSAVVSTPTIDSYNSVLHQDGISLDRFRKNPIVYRDHGWMSGELPIGQVLSITPGDSTTTAVFRLARGVEPAESVRTLMSQGIYRAMSVGFMATETEWRKGDVDDVLHVLKWDLLEISVVGIPANPDAIISPLRSMTTTDSDKELGAVLRRMIDVAQGTAVEAHLAALFLSCVDEK
jgi:HK97 family phage prohead protease